MAYNRSKAHSSQTDTLISFFRLIGGNKLYSGLMGSIILSALLSLVLSDAVARRTAENIAFALTGGGIAVGALESKLGEVRSRAQKFQSLSEELSAKLSAQELATQQREIELQTSWGHLNTQEATYKQRCENASEKRLQRELEAGKRKFQSEANKAVRQAETRLKAAEKNLTGAITQHQKILADARAHYQGQIDSTALEIQVAIDQLNSEIAAAKEETTTARQELSRANRELEVLREYHGNINQQVNEKVANAAKTVFESQSAILAEAGTEAEKAMQRTALELQWEKQERLKLNAENARLKAPKVCDLYGPQGDMARKIQGVIHGFTVERSVDGRKVAESLGYQMHWKNIREEGTSDVFMFEPLTGTADDFNRKRAEIQQTLRGATLERIEYNPNTSCIEFSVVARKKKSVNDTDFKRLVKSDSYYLKRAATWSRSQFLAPSESGKTSSAEIIGYQWATANEGDRFFHYPNKESIKNYVTADIVSVGAEECAEAFANLVHLVDDIQDGRKKPLARRQHHVFDDSDSIIARALDSLVSRDEVLDFFTRASHCGIAFTLIGHSTSANRQGGMTHSDFNNLVRIYSGLDILTALANTQVISKNRAEALKVQYEKIRDRFDSKNAEIGLITEGDTADPGAYRFVLVIEPNKAPYFCELPALDILSAGSSGHPTVPYNHPRHSTITGTPQQTPQHPDADTASNPLKTVGTPQQQPAAKKCRKCGKRLESQGIVKSGKHEGERKYVCRGKNHTRAMGAKTSYFSE